MTDGESTRGDDVHIVAADDVPLFDSLLDQLKRGKHSHLSMTRSHLSMTRYEEDSLTIYTNPSRALLMYLPEPDDWSFYVTDSTLGDGKEKFHCACGISIEFPERMTMEHSRATMIARQFFVAGQLPSDVEWRPESEA
jgi:hypothetical protein